MAGIDYTIPGQIRPIQIESPMNAMAQAMQLRAMQESSQMNALKTQEYARKAREDQELASQQNELAKIHSSGIKIGSPEYFNLVASKAPRLLESVQERALKRSELDEKVEERRYKNFDRKFNLYKSFVPTINSIDGVTQYVSAAYQDPDLSPILNQIRPYAEALNANQDEFNRDPESWKLNASGVSPEKIIEIARARAKEMRDTEDRTAPKPEKFELGGKIVTRDMNPNSPTYLKDISTDEKTAAPAAVVESPLAKLVREKTELATKDPDSPTLKIYDEAISKETGGAPPALVQEYLYAQKNNGFKGTLLDFKKQVAMAGRNVTNNPAPVTPVTIQDPNDPSKAIVVDARTNRVIGASVKEGPGVDLTAKERQAREAKYPQATAAIKTYESKSEELAKDLETLADHPGLDGISGAIFGRTPSGTKNSMAAQEKYNSIVARGGFKELADMRASSPTGGALGNVSNQEGQFLRDAFASIGRTQSKDDLAAALKDAAKRVRESKERIREAYDMTYEYRSNAAPTSNAPAADPLGIRR
jgi:hypothetical protein